jgi:hypothetical protein
VAYRLNDLGDFLVMGRHPRFQFHRIFRQFLLSQCHPPHRAEDPDDDDAHLHCPRAIEDRFSHENPMPVKAKV